MIAKIKIKHLAYGAATFVPGINRLGIKGTGGTNSARYCYSVWMRHLVMTKENGLNPYPRIVAELGPGDSLGIGLCALLSGCQKYYAFDVVEHASIEGNLAIVDELVFLFKNREPIPDDAEWPNVKPRLKDYDFPADILDNHRLEWALNESRLTDIRNSIKGKSVGESMIEYKVPWDKDMLIEPDSVDMIYSQAVLEHVDMLHDAYRGMYLWLRPNGHISHAIDFKSHGIFDSWDGHWTCPDWLWMLVRGKRPYLINREPYSTHLKHLKEAGLLHAI